MKFSIHKLDNGATCVLIPVADSPSVTVMALARVGSKYEHDNEQGLSHFVEHMFFKGTKKYPLPSSISETLEGIGARYNAFTNQEYTGYWAKVASVHVPLALDVISSMYIEPLFDAHEMKKEKGVIIEEIRMYKDMPDRHVVDVFMQALYGDTPAGRNIAGTVDSVRAFTREDFLNYFNKSYTSEATTIIVAGNFDEHSMKELVAQKFESLRQGKAHSKPEVIENITTPAIACDVRATDQTHIMLGIRSFSAKDPRRYAMRVLSTVLGGGMSSRLFKKLRDEMGVCYYIGADHDMYTDHGVLAISAGVDNSRVDEVIPVILNEITRFKTEKITEEELHRAQEYIVGSLFLGLELSNSKADYCAHSIILQDEILSPEQEAERIRNVTSDDILKLAQELFVTERLAFASVGKVTKDRVEAMLKFV